MIFQATSKKCACRSEAPPGKPAGLFRSGADGCGENVNTDTYKGEGRRHGIAHVGASTRSVLAILVALAAICTAVVTATAYVVRNEYPSKTAINAEHVALANQQNDIALEHRVTVIENSLSQMNIDGRMSRLEAQNSALLRQSQKTQDRLDRLIDLMVARDKK